MSDQENSRSGSTQTLLETSEDRRDTVVLSDVPDVNGFASTAVQPSVPDPSTNRGALARLAQRYEILSEAGRGNIGIVYKAHDRETGQTIALKLIRSDFASQQSTLDRLQNEISSARKIRHKNVCRAYDFHRTDGVAYISTEFVEGESLREVLNRSGALPLRKGIDLTLQFCSGLKEAHAQGIVHRDLKPENVMIDSQGNMKIMDFGVALAVESAARQTTAMAGAPVYMAPEQAEGKPVDCRSDIYSLGLLLYEIFTGKPIPRENNQAPSGGEQARQFPARPSGAELPIPVSIERAIFTCIEADPAKRYQSVADLERDLMSSGTRAILASGSEARTRTVLWNREAVSKSAGTATSPLVNTSSGARKLNSIILRGLIAVFLAVVALNALHWIQASRMAKKIAPPSELPTPAPPEFALDKSAAPARTARPADLRPSPSSANNTEDARDDLNPFAPQTPTPNAAAKPPAIGAAPAFLAKPVPRAAEGLRHDRVSGEETELTYLWIGRFQDQGSARAMAQEIEGLGLPAVVTSKHNPAGEFFVVLSGPFAQPKASTALGQLQAQGFTNIRVIKNLNLSQ